MQHQWYPCSKMAVRRGIAQQQTSSDLNHSTLCSSIIHHFRSFVFPISSPLFLLLHAIGLDVEPDSTIHLPIPCTGDHAGHSLSIAALHLLLVAPSAISQRAFFSAYAHPAFGQHVPATAIDCSLSCFESSFGQ